MAEVVSVYGGSWGSLPKYCQSAFSLNLYSDNRDNGIGFRVISTPLYTARTLHLRTLHPLRGGSWRTIPLRYGSSTIRDWNGPDDIALDYGFRVISTAPMTERSTPESS